MSTGRPDTRGPRRASARLLPGVALVAAALLAGQGALAAEWSVAPSANLAVDLDDNAGLASRTDEEEEISGFIVEVGTSIGYRSDLYDFSVTPRLEARRYPGDSRFDSDDQFLNFGASRRTRNGALTLGGTFKRDFIRTGERADVDLGVEDPEDIADDDSGRVGDDVRRIRWTLTPGWRFRISETSTANLRVRHTNVDYDDEEEGRLVDFYSTNVRARYFRNITQRTRGVVEANALWYNADDAVREDGVLVDNDSFGWGLKAGVSRELTETTRFELLGGFASTDRATQGTDTNWVGEANLLRRLETIRILAQYRRAVSGTGSGTLTARDQVNLNLTRELTELLRSGLGVVAYRTSSVENNVNFDERTYVQLRAQFGWQLSRTLDLDANYRYTLIDREDENESANSNSLMIWLRWRPNPYTVSR